MKILGVKFKNINALQGEWEIRFDSPPLSDTGLFAIVGPNGSGKSSILDALTLGLYGETARLKSPEQELLHWKGESSFSEVSFSVGDDCYRSRWSVRKSDGDVEAPEMDLHGLNGGETLLEDRVIRVRSRIAELTGLDFKRFCRSVLLAQGEFTSLLNALENERVEILEKIMGPEIAREMEESIRTRAAVENERLLQLKESATDFPLPDKALLKELRESHEQTVEEHQETTGLLEELWEREEWLERLRRLEAERMDASQALAETETRSARSRDALERLERARSVAPLADGLRLRDTLKADAEASLERLNALETAVPSREARMGELEERLLQIRTELEQARGKLEERGDDLLNASHRDRDIEVESQRFLEAVSHYEAMERSQKEKLEEQAVVAQGIADVEGRLRELERWLVDHGDDGRLETEVAAMEEVLQKLNATRRAIYDRETEKAGALTAEQQAAKELARADGAVDKARRKTDRLSARKAERERHLNEILEDSPSFESLIASLHDRKKKVSTCRELVKICREYEAHTPSDDMPLSSAAIEAEQQSRMESLIREREQLNELGEQIRRRDSFQRLSSDRSALASGQPCPLCGSLHHPYVEEGLPDFRDLENAVQLHEQRIKTLEEELKALDARASDMQARSQAMENLQRAWALSGAEACGGWAITDLDAILEEIRSGETEIKRIGSRIRSARWQNWMLGWVDRSLTSKEKKLAGKEAACDSVREMHESAQRARAHVEGEISRLEEEQEALLSQFAQKVRQCGEPSPERHHEIDSLELVRSRREDYRNHREEQGTLSETLQELERKREYLPRAVEELQAQGAGLAAEIQTLQVRLNELKAERETLYGTLDPVREREALTSEVDRLAAEDEVLQRETEDLRKQLEEGKNELPQMHEAVVKTQAAFEATERETLERATTAGFGSLEELRDILAVSADEQSILEEQASAEEALLAARSRARGADEAEELARAEHEMEDTPEMVRWKISEGKKRRDELQRMIEETERTLSGHREAERDYRELLQAIAVQEKIRAEAMEEQEMLQSQDDTGPKKKLQKLMLERLVEQTNKHLVEVSGRYALQTGAGDGLGLEIEDAQQGKTRRSVKTLSGGESFLVCLCLALGLSELAGKHRRIESLFLDEGFGALDEETLYRVMAALKGLRANGKMVGIISHVKRLADEIPTQIRVEKEPGGTSRIAVVA